MAVGGGGEGKAAVPVGVVSREERSLEKQRLALRAKEAAERAALEEKLTKTEEDLRRAGEKSAAANSRAVALQVIRRSDA